MTNSNQEQIANAIAYLNSHPCPVLLVPTETVYGLVCPWDNAEARDRIYEMKQRDAAKQLALFLPCPEAAQLFVSVIPETAKRIAARFMPGPVTLVIPDDNGGTFGYRVPDHPLLLPLLREYGKPLASTSANRSGEPAALQVEEALKSLAFPPDLILDGGVIPAGSKASTVIRVFADNTWEILRPGPVTEEMLRDLLV